MKTITRSDVLRYFASDCERDPSTACILRESIGPNLLCRRLTTEVETRHWVPSRSLAPDQFVIPHPPDLSDVNYHTDLVLYGGEAAMALHMLATLIDEGVVEPLDCSFI